ncbi:MAG: enoyl-CoA hydratase/isomerase family protein [Pseudomonadota bacterium]
MADLALSVSNTIARLQLNRPAVLNALSPELLSELIDLCAELRSDDEIRVVLLEGVGEHFSAGADLPSFTRGLQSDPHHTADLGRRASEAISTLPQITIAAIRGYCIGGGIVLSGACDMRVAADDTRFSIPELAAGIPLSWGGMADLVRLLGPTVANDLVLTCKPFGAAEALNAGFISRIIPHGDFDKDIDALAGLVADRPAIVLRQTKRKLNDIRAGVFDARDDAADMLDAAADEEAAAMGRAYVRERLGS